MKIMKVARVIILSAYFPGAILFAACTKAILPVPNENGAAQNTAPASSPSPASPDGAELYKDNCARCHGDAGKGSKKGIPLISGHALHHTEQQYLEQVRDGKANKMPAFRDKSSAEEIDAIVKYVRNVMQAGIDRSAEHHVHHI